MLTPAEQMEEYRQRMLYLEQERHEWMCEIHAVRMENAQMRKAIAHLRTATRHIHELNARYPEEGA